MHFGPDREDSGGNHGHACPVFVAPSADWRYLNVQFAITGHRRGHEQPCTIPRLIIGILRLQIAIDLKQHAGRQCRRNCQVRNIPDRVQGRVGMQSGKTELRQPGSHRPEVVNSPRNSPAPGMHATSDCGYGEHGRCSGIYDIPGMRLPSVKHDE